MDQINEGGSLSESDAEVIVDRNLRLNFPRYEIAIPFDESDRIFGANFSQIAERASKLPDTFGLCGVMAVTANGLMANRPSWEDVNYDPEELKTKFDSWWPTRQ